MMGDEELPRQVKENFLKVWLKKLLTYAEQNPARHQDVLQKMQQAIDLGNLAEGNNKLVDLYCKVIFRGGKASPSFLTNTEKLPLVCCTLGTLKNAIIFYLKCDSIYLWKCKIITFQMTQCIYGMLCKLSFILGM